jgi:hypothetical protein
MFEATIAESENGKVGLAVRGHFAGEFENEAEALEELQDLIKYEIEALGEDNE